MKALSSKTSDLLITPRSLILISGVILILAALIATTQKFFQFRAYPDYLLYRSLLFNFIVFVPFTLFIDLHKKFNSSNIKLFWLSLIGSGILFLIFYSVSINLGLYLADFSSQPLSRDFLLKYFSGVVQIHLSLYFFIQLLLTVKNRSEEKTRDIKNVSEPTFLSHKIKSIQWIEAYDHYIKIYTDEGRFIERGSMKDAEASLPDNFIRTHRKYIVNMDYAEGTNRKNNSLQVLIGKKKLNVSRSKEALVKQLLQLATK